MGSDKARASAASFSLLLDSPLTGDVRIASWCPTMDLCAVALRDGQVKVHRLQWQLLWVVSPESLVSALAWAPDGKMLAMGHTDGSISVHDVESGELKMRHTPRYSCIQALAWVQAASQCDAASAGSTLAKHSASTATPAEALNPTNARGRPTPAGASLLGHNARWSRFFLPPSRQPANHTLKAPGGKQPDPYAFDMQPSDGAAWSSMPETPNLLVAVDAQGTLGIWLAGEVHIVSSSLDRPHQGEGGIQSSAAAASASGITCSSDLGMLWVLWSTATSGELSRVCSWFRCYGWWCAQFVHYRAAT